MVISNAKTFCPECGKENMKVAKFCKECGKEYQIHEVADQLDKEAEEILEQYTTIIYD